MAEPGIIQIEETKTEEQLDVPWNVIVFNDPINLMSYVTLVFQRVFGQLQRRNSAPTTVPLPNG